VLHVSAVRWPGRRGWIQRAAQQKTAAYIKSKWPDKIVYVITINWAPAGQHFNAEEKAKVVALGKEVDCIFDQGHTGYHIAETERAEFIAQLPCAYGTSGGLWLYPDTRWERDSYAVTLNFSTPSVTVWERPWTEPRKEDPGCRRRWRSAICARATAGRARTGRGSGEPCARRVLLLMKSPRSFDGSDPAGGRGGGK